MGNIIKWSLPDDETTYDYVQIFRADSREGNYSIIETQAISDNSYFDIDGTNDSWYRVRFKDDSESKFSQYSEPIQGGKFAGYCNINDIRNFSSKMTSTAIPDTTIFELIKFATAQINQDILIEHRNEQVKYISNDKENDIDGVNKTFYVRYPYLADYNDDGIIDEEDIFVYTIDSQGNRTECVVDEINDTRFGEFTLETAPSSGEEMYIDYRSSPVLLYPNVNMNVRKACINYVLALSHMRLDPNQMRSFKVNKVSVTGDSSPSKQYMQNYTNLISKVISKQIVMKKSENVV